MLSLPRGQSPYPANLTVYLGQNAPDPVGAWGNLELLSHSFLAFFCSVKCPGSLILKTYDLAQGLRQAGVPVAGGFHSPIEKECLTILLRGSNPLLLCPARSLAGMRLPAGWQAPLQQGRLLLLSPFPEKQRRANAKMAQARNRFVAALAGSIFITHAAPGGKTEAFCREILGWGKPVYTFKHEVNDHLLALGVQGVTKIEELIPVDPNKVRKKN